MDVTHQSSQCDVQTPDSVAVYLKQRYIQSVLLTSAFKRHSRSTSLGIGKDFYINVYKYKSNSFLPFSECSLKMVGRSLPLSYYNNLFKVSFV